MQFSAYVAGPLKLFAWQSIEIPQIRSLSGDIVVESMGNIKLITARLNSATLSLIARGNILTDGLSSLGGLIELNASGSISQLDPNSSLIASETLDISSSKNVDLNTDISFLSAVIRGNGTLTLKDKGSLIISSISANQSNLTIEAENDITVQSISALSSIINITSDNGILSVDTFSNPLGSVSLKAAGNITGINPTTIFETKALSFSRYQQR